MTAKNYLLLCLAVVVLVPLLVMFVPGVAQAFETILLTFLSTTAS
ncbi:MAG: hypothetical protein PVH91_09020 [Pseudomonadales bacterium]|jgi:hypothetical protein